MYVLYMGFGSKVRPRTCGCVAMGSAVMLILRSKLFLYSTESGVNRVQVALSGFSVRLLCFIQEKLNVSVVVFISWPHTYFVCTCDGDVICVGHDMNRWSGWW